MSAFNRIIYNETCITLIREAAKKKLVAGPLRPYPPPLELNGHRNFFLLDFFFSLKIAKNGF